MDKKMTRAARRRKQRNRRILMTIALMMLVAVVSIGGTVAWLTDKTDTVTNTFTESDVDIELTEETGKNAQYTFKMVPGVDIAKDPKVTIKSGSEASWVFVEVTEVNDVDKYLTYEIAEGWTLVPGESNVYYIEQNATTADVTYSVLAGDKVTVNNTVTKADMDALETSATDIDPKLTFKAYAIQKSGFDTPAAAWAEAKK